MTPEDVVKANAGSFFPTLALSPTISNLFNNTAAISLVSSATGTPCKPTWGGQIALRFPGTLSPPFPPHLLTRRDYLSSLRHTLYRSKEFYSCTMVGQGVACRWLSCRTQRHPQRDHQELHCLGGNRPLGYPRGLLRQPLCVPPLASCPRTIF